jgi:hypothetical protein
MSLSSDGDWVESLTACVEDMDGTLRLLSHRGETLVEIPPRSVVDRPVRWRDAA